VNIETMFTVVRCANCTLHYLNPQPTLQDLESHYPATYDPFTTPAPGELPALQRLSLNYGLRKRCREVLRHKHEGRLLEIGCASGLFLDALRREGNWQVQGVDTSELAVRYAREQFGLDVFLGPVEDARFADGSFDAVVMWDVLEHVHRPRETLLEIHRLLKADGVLIIRAPLLGSWDQAFFGRYWAGWDIPRHLTIFSMRTLQLMLEYSGFRLKRTASISGSYPSFVQSLRFWASEHRSAPAQARLRQVLESLPVRLAAAPFFFAADRMGKSSAVTVVVQPDPTEG
jgi:SAM-dependent methyltransferase